MSARAEEYTAAAVTKTVRDVFVSSAADIEQLQANLAETSGAALCPLVAGPMADRPDRPGPLLPGQVPRLHETESRTPLTAFLEVVASRVLTAGCTCRKGDRTRVRRV